jgi:hypothetical protein
MIYYNRTRITLQKKSKTTRQKNSSIRRSVGFAQNVALFFWLSLFFDFSSLSLYCLRLDGY